METITEPYPLIFTPEEAVAFAALQETMKQNLDAFEHKRQTMFLWQSHEGTRLGDILDPDAAKRFTPVFYQDWKRETYGPYTDEAFKVFVEALTPYARLYPEREISPDENCNLAPGMLVAAHKMMFNIYATKPHFDRPPYWNEKNSCHHLRAVISTSRPTVFIKPPPSTTLEQMVDYSQFDGSEFSSSNLKTGKRCEIAIRTRNRQAQIMKHRNDRSAAPDNAWAVFCAEDTMHYGRERPGPFAYANAACPIIGAYKPR
jgi:hypothetical protein